MKSRPHPSRFPLLRRERIWFWDQVEPYSPLYNLPIVLRIRGELDIDALRNSLDLVVARHEALRTTFVSNRGKPSQAIQPARPVEFSVNKLQDRGAWGTLCDWL